MFKVGDLVIFNQKRADEYSQYDITNQYTICVVDEVNSRERLIYARPIKSTHSSGLFLDRNGFVSRSQDQYPGKSHCVRAEYFDLYKAKEPGGHYPNWW